MTGEDRYRNDSAFRLLVDNLEQFISNGTFTPSELRIALILAATHYEMRRTDVAWAIDKNGTGTVIMERVGNIRKVRS
jgi:hypothetical protein